MSETYQFLGGVLVALYLVISLFFLKFWRNTRDRLLLCFGAAFFVFAVERVAFAIIGDPNSEAHASIYLFRLCGFLLIVIGILEKNRGQDH